MEKSGSSEIIKLIKEIGAYYSLRIKNEAELLGIKNAYRQLLFALSKRDGDTQLSLVERTGLKAPTVSITLRKMEKEGFVRRETDENDLRKTHVYMTEKGISANTALLNKISETEDKTFAGLTNEEREAFIKSLEKIKKALM